MDETRLGDFLSLSRDGHRIQPEDIYATAGILSYGRGLFTRPEVLGGDVSYSTYYRLREGQFVYSKLFAWEGALAIVGVDFDGLWVSQEFPTFDVNPERALPSFVGLLCRWPELWQRVRAGESGMGGRRKRVHPDRLMEVTVPLPPLSDQARMVDLVEAVDRLVDTNERVRQAQAEVTARIADDLIWNAGWDLVATRDLAPKRGLVGGPFGSSLGSKDYVVDGVPVIRGANLSTGTRWVGGEFVYVTEEKADALSRNMALPGDVIFTQRGTVGQVGLVPDDVFDRYVISQSQMRLRPDPDLVSAEYVYWAFRTDRTVAEVELRKIATANPHINLGILGEIQIPVPPVAEQQEIVDVVNDAAQVLETAAAALRKGLVLRAALLDELLSGRHEIPESYDELLEAV
jgi:type I restriction enzyme S subunit